MIRYITKLLGKRFLKDILMVAFLAASMPFVSNIIPYLTQTIFDKGIILGNVNLIISITACIIGLHGLKALVNNLMQRRIIKINLGFITALKKETLEKVVNMPTAFYDNNSSQYILNRINEVDNLSKLISSDMINFIVNIISALVALIILIEKSILVAVAAISLMPIFIIVSNKSFKKINAQITDSLETAAKTNDQLFSTLDGITTMKQFNKEKELIKEIGKSIDNLALRLSAQSSNVAKSVNLITFYTNAIHCALLALVGGCIVSGNLGLGDYVAMGQYIGLLYVPALGVQNINITMRPALVSYKRLKELSHIQTISYEGEQIKKINSIDIEELYFSYEGGQKILGDLNIHLKKGDKLLIKGKNGSGKTTLIKLLSGFYTTYEGYIKFNGIELKNLNAESIRDRISILPQRTHLFNMTVKDNIRIAVQELNEELFEKRLNSLVDLGILDGIRLDEYIIDNGKNLSGGQIQRIALSRAIIRDCDIIMFDEFTNALDANVQQTIKDVLLGELSEKICIFITHNNLIDELCNKKITLL